MEILSTGFRVDSNNGYLNYHKKRYLEIYKIIKLSNFKNPRILDIGNSDFSKILSETIKGQVDEIGFYADEKMPHGKRYQFDLNKSQDETLWRKDIEGYDIVVFTEVIEHLYTSPLLVLTFLKSLLNKNGIIILQTPNAVVFHKRIQMLFGKNPFMLINENTQNPWHFREYTKKELNLYAVKSGFEVVKSYYASYFDYRFSNHEKPNKFLILVNWFYKLMPSFLKPGITMILKKV